MNPTPTSESAIETEARRVACAFGVEAWAAVNSREATNYDLAVPTKEMLADYRGLSGEFVLDCVFRDSIGDCVCFEVGRQSYTTVAFIGFQWRIIKGRHTTDTFMARGLYRLGFEDTAILEQLPPLSGHEKLELRLSMPREFWPQAWLDEGGP